MQLITPIGIYDIMTTILLIIDWNTLCC